MANPYTCNKGQPYTDHEIAYLEGGGDVAVLRAQGFDMEVAVDEKGRTALARAARLGQPMAVQALCAAGAAVNREDNQGRTPLILALHGTHTWQRKEAVMRTLLVRGAAVEIADNMGCTALHAAVVLTGVCGTRMLLAAGAEPDVDSRLGTPQHLARIKNKAALPLLQAAVRRKHAGASASASDDRGFSPQL